MGRIIDFKPLRFLFKYLSDVKERPADGTAFTFLVVISLLTYFNGTYVLLPQLLAALGFPSGLIFIACVLTTWIVTAILSNLLLIRYRSSSIVSRMLLQPAIKTPTFKSFINNPDDVIKEQTKSMGQHFMPKPFGEDENWHICAACEVFVPPRAWHCSQCKTCILRRDHHCVFAMSCIGEENHTNFLGLVMYLGIGSSLATVVNVMYTLMFTDTPFWLFCIKAFIPFYVLIFDFSVLNMLSAVNFLGMGISWVVFVMYILMAFRSQTTVENARNSDTNAPKYAYHHAEKFLGRNPVRRLFWPFHSCFKNFYGPHPETRKEMGDDNLKIH